MFNIAEKTEFDKIISSNDFVIVDFYATWCGPCRMLSAVIDEYAASNPEATVVKIDVDEAKELAAEYNVMSLPTIMLFKNGSEIASKVGFLSKSAFLKFIEENK